MPNKRMHMITSRCSWLLLFVLGFPTNDATGNERPLNAVVLLVDDWGWTDASCYGSDLYKTPNIDQLASDGVRFTNAYAACTVCSPTRAAILTGKYPARTRLTDFIPGKDVSNTPVVIPKWTQRLEPKHLTIAEAFTACGYRTACVGKWHLTPRCNHPAVVEPYLPQHHGFEIGIDRHPSRGGRTPDMVTQLETARPLVVWHPMAVRLEGPAHSETDDDPNPFLDYRLEVRFTVPPGPRSWRARGQCHDQGPTPKGGGIQSVGSRKGLGSLTPPRRFPSPD